MITLIKKGRYKLVSIGADKKMLYLGTQGYIWTYAKGIGELLTFSGHLHKQYYILATGDYRMYKVKNESKLTDLIHLELAVGREKWQGYLLLTNLPTRLKIRSRIIATDETISDYLLK